MKGGTPCMGISSRRAHPHTHINQNKGKSVPINVFHSATVNGTRSRRMSPKKCVFGCKGKIILFILPKNPALREQWMQCVFPGQKLSFENVFVEECFINNAQFGAGSAHRLSK